MYSSIVVIRLRDDQQLFVHPVVLTRSPFLVNLLDKANGNVVDMPDVDFAPMTYIIRFLRGELLIRLNDHSHNGEYMEALTKTYILAIRFDIKSFQNELMDELMKLYRTAASEVSAMQLLDKAVDNDNLLLRFMIKQLAYDMQNQVFEDENLAGWAMAGGYTVQEVMRRLAGPEFSDPCLDPNSIWHIHQEDGLCACMTCEANDPDYDEAEAVATDEEMSDDEETTT